jgi:hypothetical protein
VEGAKDLLNRIFRRQFYQVTKNWNLTVPSLLWVIKSGHCLPNS